MEWSSHESICIYDSDKILRGSEKVGSRNCVE
jgi:hypothetical protein